MIANIFKVYKKFIVIIYNIILILLMLFKF
jgi:hypothetical protein